jgi:hypothetical protein
MSKIQERLNSLRPYVVGIRYLQGIQLVDAILKDGWKIPSSEIIRVEPADDVPNYYMFFSDDEAIDIDDLLNYVQEVINHNLEREAKHKLLKEKVDELKVLFKNNGLNKLIKLKFSFEEPNLVPSLSDMDDFDEEDSLDYADETFDEEVVAKREPQKIVNETEIYKPIKKTNEQTTKFNDIDLPPKGEKIEVETFDEPDIVCKCGPNDICPICADSKGM